MIQLSALAATLLLSVVAQDGVAAQDGLSTEQVHRMRVTLQNGRVYTGDVTIDGAGDLTLSSKAVGEDAALEFGALRSLARLDDLGRIKDVDVDTRAAGPGRSEYVRLYRQQRLVGQLSGINARAIEFESAGFGPLAIPRAAMGEVISLGKAGSPAVEGLDLERWRQWKGVLPSERRGVSVGTGGVVLEKVGAHIELAEPPVDVRVEFGVEWRGLPEFALRFGADERAPRIEVWDGVPTLITWGEGGDIRVEPAKVQLEMDSSAVLHLVFKGTSATLRTIEVGSNGRVDCDLSADLDQRPPGLMVEAMGRPMQIFAGAIRSLEPPEEGELSAPRVLRGSELVGFEPEGRIVDLDGERMALAGVPLIRFVGRQEQALLDQPGARPGSGQLALIDGEMIEISGATLEGGVVRVTSPFIEGEFAVPLASIQRLALPATEPAQLKATYEMTFWRASAGGEAPVRAESTTTASLRQLQRSDEGALELVRSEPGFKGEVTARLDGPITLTRASSSRLRVSRRDFPHQVVLRSGETFPAKVTFGEDGGITALTPFVDRSVQVGRGDLRAVFVDPRQAIALLGQLEKQRARQADGMNEDLIIFGRAPEPTPVKGELTDTRLERALLVPRAQADAPGTHLLVAVNGDLLRTTVVGQTDAALEVRDHSGATMEIPLKVIGLCVPLVLGEEPERPEQPWVFDLGGRALLCGELVRGTQESFTVDHPLLGQVELPTESAGLVTYGQPLVGRHGVVAGWRATPMPEPNLPD